MWKRASPWTFAPLDSTWPEFPREGWRIADVGELERETPRSSRRVVAVGVFNSRYQLLDPVRDVLWPSTWPPHHGLPAGDPREFVEVSNYRNAWWPSYYKTCADPRAFFICIIDDSPLGDVATRERQDIRVPEYLDIEVSSTFGTASLRCYSILTSHGAPSFGRPCFRSAWLRIVQTNKALLWVPERYRLLDAIDTGPGRVTNEKTRAGPQLLPVPLGGQLRIAYSPLPTSGGGRVRALELAAFVGGNVRGSGESPVASSVPPYQAAPTREDDIIELRVAVRVFSRVSDASLVRWDEASNESGAPRWFEIAGLVEPRESGTVLVGNGVFKYGYWVYTHSGVPGSPIIYRLAGLTRVRERNPIGEYPIDSSGKRMRTVEGFSAATPVLYSSKRPAVSQAVLDAEIADANAVLAQAGVRLRVVAVETGKEGLPIPAAILTRCALRTEEEAEVRGSEGYRGAGVGTYNAPDSGELLASLYRELSARTDAVQLLYVQSAATLRFEAGVGGLGVSGPRLAILEPVHGVAISGLGSVPLVVVGAEVEDEGIVTVTAHEMAHVVLGATLAEEEWRVRPGDHVKAPYHVLVDRTVEGVNWYEAWAEEQRQLGPYKFQEDRSKPATGAMKVYRGDEVQRIRERLTIGEAAEDEVVRLRDCVK